MSKILVFSEFQNNSLKRSSQELLQFAIKSSTSVIGFSLGTQAGANAAQMAHHGATEIHISKDAGFDAYNPELFATAVAEAIQKTGATIVLASASALAKDLFPRVAAKLSCGVVSDGVEITIAGDDVRVKKPLYVFLIHN